MQRRTMAIARLNTPESVGGALRRAAASGGGVVPAGLVMVSMPPKVAGDRPKYHVAGPLVGSFRSVDDHVAFHKRRLHKLLSYHLRQRWSRGHGGMTGMRQWLPVSPRGGQRQSSLEAMVAPSARHFSFAHMIERCTRPASGLCENPQSVPAMTLSRPTMSA